jgi:hypothetical protein
MKMVKSLLLGSAAGLVAVAGAQAADLPVKAKPVQYVKICSLYGVGFYYIPGTDMCIKIGGWVRAEYGWGQNGNFAWGWASANVNNRTTNNSDFRARGYITADARNQTEYGTVRGYIAVGLSENEHGGDVNASTAFSANRAFIQWAGFTFGRSQSFFDFYSSPATAYWGAYPSSDTGDGGWFVMGYTAQFGNGFSGTLAAEAPRKTIIVNTGTTGGLFTTAPGVLGTGTELALNAPYGGFQAPDIVANLRVDQAWGSAQIMGALHEVNTTYYNPTGAFIGNAAGHPDDKWGWVLGFGFKLNAPMIGQGDYLQTQFNYTQGALRYVMQTPNSNWAFVDGGSQSLALMNDAVYGGNVTTNGTDLELTTAWNVNAAYEHFWSPRWRTSLYGGYAQVSYGGSANAMLCSFAGFGTGFGSTALASAGCDNDWQTWWIGSRTQWNVTKDFYMGVDVLYQKLQSGSTPTGLLNAPQILAASPVTPVFVTDPDNWSIRFRVHRDFYP